MNRFEKPGSRQWAIMGIHNNEGQLQPVETAKIWADYIKFEPGFITFWNGREMEVKTLVASVKVDESIVGVAEQPLDKDRLQKLLDYESSFLSDTNRAHFDHFINLSTGETYREYLDNRDAREKDDPFIWDGLGSMDVVAHHRHVHHTDGRCIKNSFGPYCESRKVWAR